MSKNIDQRFESNELNKQLSFPSEEIGDEYRRRDTVPLANPIFQTYQLKTTLNVTTDILILQQAKCFDHS